ncbi:MAG: hypothetical protein GYB58_15720 [Gammaproteobacteria bacterium]|nr:hypothetical protein [Gammaproteobacteria bacterium]
MLEEPHFCGPYRSEAETLPDIVPTLYEVVSGTPGEERNWQLLHELFAPSATITPLFHREGMPDISVLTTSEFVELNKLLFKDVGFYETEIHSQTIQVGHMATVISAYESREAPDKPAYSRGINTFQLVNDGRRWCVISVTWDSDKGGHDIAGSIAEVFGKE